MNSSLLHHFFESFCPLNAALINGEGEALYIRTDNSLHNATLLTATQTVMAYLPLQVGDIGLLNDPYSGGSTLNELTFVVKITEAGPQSLWLTWRRQFSEAVIFAKSVEEEGLRIPPTPIYQNKKPNQFILDAMAGHPLCPSGFSPWVTGICRELEAKVALFNKVLRKQKISLTKADQKDYLQSTRDLVRHKISEAASGETRVEVFLDNKEMIRLQMDIHEGLVKMDFAGTSASKTHLLTESAAYGVCLGALAQFYGFTETMNSSTFSILEVTKPSHCLLNAKYPAPLSAGSMAVKAALQTAISLALAHIHTKKQKAMSAYCPLEIELQKSTGETQFIRLPGGCGADAELSAHDFATNHPLRENVSVERIERHWPLRIRRFDYRPAIIDKEEFNGGRGLSLSFQALESLIVRWRADLTKTRPKVSRQGTLGEVSQVSLRRGTDAATEEVLAASGSLELRAGDCVNFSSGHGGSWAKKIEIKEP